MASPIANDFRRALAGIFDSWTALRIAVHQGFGGIDSSQKADWMVDAVEQWMNENSDVEEDELEDCIADILNTEFELILEDGSLQQVSRDVCTCHRLFKQGKDVSSYFSLPKVSAEELIRTALDAAHDESSSSDDENINTQPPPQLSRLSNSTMSESLHGTEETSQHSIGACSTTTTKSNDEETPSAMEEDSEWTTVSRHRKR